MLMYLFQALRVSACINLTQMMCYFVIVKSFDGKRRLIHTEKLTDNHK